MYIPPTELQPTRHVDEIRTPYSANADSFFNQDWAQAISDQQTRFLRANIDVIGLRKPSKDAPPVKMLDYACGFGISSLVIRKSLPREARDINVPGRQ
jgi:hypothetical protein